MALARPSKLTFNTMEDGTYSGYVSIQAPCPVRLSIWGTWGSATLTLWKSHDQGATYHAFKPATDSTALLTGTAFSITNDLDTVFDSEPCLIRWVISGGTGESLNMKWGGRYVRGHEGTLT